MRISENRHYLLDDREQPFFYLADTAWRLFYCATREEAERYLRKRKEQGFTVFMPLILSEVVAGESDANRYGHMALHDWNPSTPNEAFFRHVDYVLQAAQALGMVAALLPTWGEFVGPLKYGKGPQCFTEANAFDYGLFLGDRYRDLPGLIWVLGGDRNPEEPALVAIWRRMAEGLRQGDGGRHLITYHPAPRPDIDRFSSADWLADAQWLDFNMLQTGTTIDRANHVYVLRDYERTGSQAKPTLDGECRYEHSHEYFNQFPVPNAPYGRRIDDHQVRKAAYNAMLSGAAGHTYGCRCVWNFYRPQEGPKTRDTDLDWRVAMDLPGAWQMGLLRGLFERYPFYRLRPDTQGRFIVGGNGTGGTYIPAALSDAGDFALAYIPEAMPFSIDTQLLGGAVRMLWYDVRTGAYVTHYEGAPCGVMYVVPFDERQADHVFIMERLFRSGG